MPLLPVTHLFTSRMNNDVCYQVAVPPQSFTTKVFSDHRKVSDLTNNIGYSNSKSEDELSHVPPSSLLPSPLAERSLETTTNKTVVNSKIAPLPNQTVSTEIVPNGITVVKPKVISKKHKLESESDSSSTKRAHKSPFLKYLVH